LTDQISERKIFQIDKNPLVSIRDCEYQPILPINKSMLSARQPVEAPIGTVGRATLCGTALFLIVGFGIAVLLKPDPRGFGTHQQLGLPPCAFRFFVNRPCPGCGMTTCFAHFVRGQFAAAVQANPAGTLLATVCLLLIPWCFWSAYRGRLWMVSDPVPVVTALSVSLAGLIFLLWATRMLAWV